MCYVEAGVPVPWEDGEPRGHMPLPRPPHHSPQHLAALHPAEPGRATLHPSEPGIAALHPSEPGRAALHPSEPGIAALHPSEPGTASPFRTR